MLYKGKIPLYPFFSGDLQGEDSLRVSVPLLPLLSALPASLALVPGWKRARTGAVGALNWGCAPALHGHSPAASASATPGKEKGPGGISWCQGLPRRGVQGTESQGIPGPVGGLAGGIHPGGFIQEEFILEEFIPEVGMVHGKGVRAPKESYLLLLCLFLLLLSPFLHLFVPIFTPVEPI